jgi:hypothetical protein
LSQTGAAHRRVTPSRAGFRPRRRVCRPRVPWAGAALSCAGNGRPSADGPPQPLSKTSPDHLNRLSRCDEVGGQPLGDKGIQPPPPEPDRHVFVHPALQTQDLHVCLHFRSASSLSRAERLIRVTPFVWKPCVLSPLGRGLLRGLCRPGPCGLEAIPWLSVSSDPRLGPPLVPCPCSLQGVSCRKITGANGRSP